MRLDIWVNKLTDLAVNKVILEDIRTSIKSGEILCVGGNTGCGKTTLLKVIAGLIPQVRPAKFQGNILLDGEEISKLDYANKVSFSFQEPEHQFLLNTVEREIFFHLSDIEHNNANRLIEFFGFSRYIKKSLSDLSTGQRKIVSLITTLSKSSKIKVLDEPSANIDQTNLNKLIKLLIDLSKENIIILSSHDDNILNIGQKFIIYDEETNSWKNTRDLPVKKRKKNFKTKTKINYGKEIIFLKNADFTYPDGTTAFHNLTISLKEGEIIGLVGRNGSGKTTLTKVIADKLERLNFANKKRIAIVMQEPEKQLFFNSVKAEIERSGANDDEDVISLLKKINLYKKKDEHPYFLSRGEKQVLLISAIIRSNPEILIIDEPFTGLDYKSIDKIIKILLDYYNKNHPAIILTEQEDSIIKNICSRIINI